MGSARHGGVEILRLYPAMTATCLRTQRKIGATKIFFSSLLFLKILSGPISFLSSSSFSWMIFFQDGVRFLALISIDKIHSILRIICKVGRISGGSGETVGWF